MIVHLYSDCAPEAHLYWINLDIDKIRLNPKLIYSFLEAHVCISNDAAGAQLLIISCI